MDKARIEFYDFLFKIVAALFAAGWAVALLLLIHRPLARAGLLKSRMESEEYEVKKNLGLSIDMQAASHRDPGGTGYIINAVVNITNLGNNDIKQIKWEGQAAAPLIVHPAKFDKEGNVHYDDNDGRKELFVRRTSNPNSRAMSHRIRPGATESICFAVGVSTPGLYMLSFRIPVDPDDQKAAEKFNLPLPGAWTCNRHVVVGDTPQPPAA